MLHLFKLHNQLVLTEIKSKKTELFFTFALFVFSEFILLKYELFTLSTFILFLNLFAIQTYYKQSINRTGILNKSEFSSTKLAHIFMLFDLFEHKTILFIIHFLLVSIIVNLWIAFFILILFAGFSSLISWYSIKTKKVQARTYRHASIIAGAIFPFLVFSSIGNSENPVALRTFLHSVESKIAENIEIMYLFAFLIFGIFYLLSISYAKKNVETMKLIFPEFTTVEKIKK